MIDPTKHRGRILIISVFPIIVLLQQFVLLIFLKHSHLHEHERKKFPISGQAVAILLFYIILGLFSLRIIQFNRPGEITKLKRRREPLTLFNAGFLPQLVLNQKGTQFKMIYYSCTRTRSSVLVISNMLSRFCTLAVLIICKIKAVKDKPSRLR